MADRSPAAAVSRRLLIHPLQTLFAQAAFAFIRRLAYDKASALGGRIGRVIGPRLKVTGLARRNLSRAFPERTPEEIEAIIGDMWDNLGRTAFEFPHLDRLRFYEADSIVEVTGAENIDFLKDDGKPGIFFSGHLANWETAAISVVQRGLPIHLIYRAPNNPRMERLFNHRHPGAGELIRKGPLGARRALARLKEGGHLGILADQKMNDGIPVPFFGRDAMTAPAVAQLALKFNCPVVPVRVERLGGARLRITHFPPMEIEKTGDRHADVAALMARINALLEGWIRERPAQWLWVHNRWPG